MKYLLTMIWAVFLLISCNDDNEIPNNHKPPSAARKTVIVYMIAENNLSGNATADLTEMAAGSKNIPDDVNLVAFVDNTDKNNPPYIARIAGGKICKNTGYNSAGNEFYASDPQKMSEILSRIITEYPAEEYRLVLWGHASGWLIEQDTIAYRTAHQASQTVRRAYGYDTGADMDGNGGRKWINIPTLANVLEGLRIRFKFILADICNFQSAEVAYELRNTADFIIGSPAEIPAIGAPYDKIVPLLFGTSDDFYKKIVDTYFEQEDYYGNKVPLSVIKTNEMEYLAYITNRIIALLPEDGTIKTEDAIFYYGERSRADVIKILTDIDCIMSGNIRYAEAYDEWKAQLNRTVVYKKWTRKWTTSYNIDFDFKDAEGLYGGMSVFVPQKIYDDRVLRYDYNNDIKRLEWYYAAGMDFYYNKSIKKDIDNIY